MSAISAPSPLAEAESGLGSKHSKPPSPASSPSAHGSKLVATYVEVESGKRDDRPEIAKAMQHAKPVGGKLLIAKLDRLSRNAAFLINL
jgi:hypothetical protein